MTEMCSLTILRPYRSEVKMLAEPYSLLRDSEESLLLPLLLLLVAGSPWPVVTTLSFCLCLHFAFSSMCVATLPRLSSFLKQLC